MTNFTIKMWLASNIRVSRARGGSEAKVPRNIFLGGDFDVDHVAER